MVAIGMRRRWFVTDSVAISQSERASDELDGGRCTVTSQQPDERPREDTTSDTDDEEHDTRRLVGQMQ
jgi:hypothetical protein